MVNAAIAFPSRPELTLDDRLTAAEMSENRTREVRRRVAVATAHGPDVARVVRRSAEVSAELRRVLGPDFR